MVHNFLNQLLVENLVENVNTTRCYLLVVTAYWDNMICLKSRTVVTVVPQARMREGDKLQIVSAGRAARTELSAC